MRKGRVAYGFKRHRRDVHANTVQLALELDIHRRLLGVHREEFMTEVKWMKSMQWILLGHGQDRSAV